MSDAVNTGGSQTTEAGHAGAAAVSPEQKQARVAALQQFQEVAEAATRGELTPEQVHILNLAIAGDMNLDAHLGLEYTAVGPRGVATRLEIGAQLLQPWGVTHGGVYAAVGESAGSVASYIAAGARAAVMGTSNHTDFLRPSHRGDVILSSATPEHIGRTTQLWRIEHRDEKSGKLVALTRLKTAVVPGSRPTL